MDRICYCTFQTIFTNFTVLIYFILTCNLIINNKYSEFLLYYYMPAN